MSSKDITEKIMAQINAKPAQSTASSRSSPRVPRSSVPRRASSTLRSTQQWNDRLQQAQRPTAAESSLTLGPEDGGGCIGCFQRGDWSPNWGMETRIALMLFVTITSLYVVVYWVIYASRLDHRPGLFMSFTCILLAIALFVSVATAKKLMEIFSDVNIEVKTPAPTPTPTTEV